MPFQSDFYNDVYSTARSLGANDVQARLAAAQASEETGYGQSMVGNNAFGVKAGPSYTGPSVTASTQEDYGNGMVRENANFRAYGGLAESVRDYLGVIQENFPDAWNAPTFSEAVKGLNTGVYGKYATNRAYGNNITAIDKQMGQFSYAANPENVPTPFGPGVQQSTSLLTDLAPVFSPDFRVPDPESAFAANPENVPTPSSAVRTTADAYQPEMSSASSPFNSVLTERQPWTINGVVPAPLPNNENWSQMAAAGPFQSTVQSPLAEVTASQPPMDSFSQLAAAGPFGGQYAQQAPIDSMGQGILAERSHLGTGVYSPEMQQMAAETRYRSLNPTSQRYGYPATSVGIGNPLATPAMPTGLLASNPVVTSPLSAYTAPTAVTPAEQAISAASPLSATPSMTPAQIAGYQQAAQSMAKAGMLNIGQQPPTTLSGELPTNFDVLGTSNLPVVEIAEQPTISTAVEDNSYIEGPTNTPAVDQQQTAQTQNAVAQAGAKAIEKASFGDRLKASLNPGTAVGGILGGAVLGPVGGILGSLLGNKMYQGGMLDGGLGSFGFSNQAPAMNTIGYGPQAAYSVWSGGQAPGTTAYASDGSRISAQAGGDVARTNSFGTTDVANSYGGYAHDLSGWY